MSIVTASIEAKQDVLSECMCIDVSRLGTEISTTWSVGFNSCGDLQLSQGCFVSLCFNQKISPIFLIYGVLHLEYANKLCFEYKIKLGVLVLFSKD